METKIENKRLEVSLGLVNKIPSTSFIQKRSFSWLTNEQIASILISTDKHSEWFTKTRVLRPENGQLLLFNRKETKKYRQDKYTWKTKRKSKFLREDRMKLKISGVPYITATYVHSDILPTFHRRSYWLIENPNVVLVHYLNYPYLEDGNHVVRDFSLNRHCDQWICHTRDEVFQQLLPMFSQMPWPRQNSLSLTQKSKEMIVNHLLDQHYSESASKLNNNSPKKQSTIQPKTSITRNLLPNELMTSVVRQQASQQVVTLQLADSQQICIINPPPPQTGGGGGHVLLSAPTNAIPVAQETSCHQIPVVHGNQVLEPTLIERDSTINKSDYDDISSYINVSEPHNIGTLLVGGGGEDKLLTSTDDIFHSTDSLLTSCNLQDQHSLTTTRDDSKRSSLDEDHIAFSPKQFLRLSADDVSNHELPDLGAPLLSDDALFSQVSITRSNEEADPWDSLDLESCLRDSSGLSDESVDITDYSPDWAYTEGGIKILVIGNWSRMGDYKCVFDQSTVEAVKLQNGVLRCYCPSHTVGNVDLYVTYNGVIISSKVKFEYKQIPQPYQHMSTQWLQLQDNEFKLSILERLQNVENRLKSFGGSSDQNNPSGSSNKQNNNHQYCILGNIELENKICRLCETINNFAANNKFDSHNSIWDNISASKEMSLIHCAAALGFVKLIRIMHNLWLGGKNEFLKKQCNPFNRDTFRQTPLMWACGSGNAECAQFLNEWEKIGADVINIASSGTDVIGRSAVGIANSRGYQFITERLSLLSMNGRGNAVVSDDSLSIETSSEDSGEFSMSTDNDVSLNDCENQAMEGVSSGEKVNDENEFVVEEQTVKNDSDHLYNLACQVLEVCNNNTNYSQQQPVTKAYPLSCLGDAATINFKGDLENLLPETNSISWQNFLQLEAEPQLNQLGNFFDLNSSCLHSNEKYHLYQAAHCVVDDNKSCSDDVYRANLIIKYCYSKYKEFTSVKKMNEAAVLIQSKFRSYTEKKRFQRSRHAAILIQASYRNYKSIQRKYPKNSKNGLLKKQQNQAARKIQRFLRKCRYHRHQLQSC